MGKIRNTIGRLLCPGMLRELRVAQAELHVLWKANSEQAARIIRLRADVDALKAPSQPRRCVYIDGEMNDTLVIGDSRISLIASNEEVVAQINNAVNKASNHAGVIAGLRDLSPHFTGIGRYLDAVLADTAPSGVTCITHGPHLGNEIATSEPVTPYPCALRHLTRVATKAKPKKAATRKPTPKAPAKRKAAPKKRAKR